MQSFGSDRVRDDGEQVILLSRTSKGWTARMPKTFTSAEFPGTAVLWEERYFEVAIAEPLPQGGVRYVLEPWREHLAMRVTDRYDQESEAFRLEEHRKALLREKHRKSVNAMALFAGHLPAFVQNELGRELGILPHRLTVASVFGTFMIVAALILLSVHRVMNQHPIPLHLLLPAGYLGVENAIRFYIAWSQNRPIGSVVGFIAYLLYYAITRRGPSPFATEKGWAVKISDAPPDIAERDAFVVREAFVTLLTPAEQARVAERFGYDYRRDSAKLATLILVFAAFGVYSSYTTGKVVTLLVAAALATEQIVRLIAFRRGPAASVLRFLVRPFVRKLL
jgi:hypothetical protein